MKKLSILLLTVLFAACGNKSKTTDIDADFDAFKQRFVDQLWVLYPGWASSVGYHKYDSILVVPNDAFHQKELAFSKSYLDTLHSFDKEKLSPNNRTDHAMIDNALSVPHQSHMAATGTLCDLKLAKLSLSWHHSPGHRAIDRLEPADPLHEWRRWPRCATASNVQPACLVHPVS